MNQVHEPDDRFIEHLDWQLASEYRRLNRLPPAPAKITISRRSAAIAALVGVVLAGASAFGTAAYLKDSWRKKIEIARTETEVKLCSSRLAAAREIAARAESLFAKGLVEEEEKLATALAAEKAALAMRTAEINLDEVNATGESPRFDLSAPMIGGRDFVSERLEIELKKADLDMTPLQLRSERFQRLVETGMAQAEALEEIRIARAILEAKVGEARKRLDMRNRFVTGMITAEAVELDGRTAEAEKSLQTAMAKVKALEEQAERLQGLQTRGLVPVEEVRQTRYALEAAQFELKLAAAELDILKKAR